MSNLSELEVEIFPQLSRRSCEVPVGAHVWCLPLPARMVGAGNQGPRGGGIAMVKELRPDDPAAIGPYRLLGRLGTGGMGNVFLGQSPGGRLVAVKVIRPELADEPGFRVRFAREVAAARHVSGLFTALVVDADA